MTKSSIASTSLFMAGALALFAASCAGEGAGAGTAGTGGHQAAGGTTGAAGINGGGGTVGGGGGTSGGAGTVGTGGSGGTPGSGGTGPSTAGSLTTVGGYFMSGGLKGYFWTSADTGGSTIAPANYAVDGHICASGTAAMVVGGAFSTTWGALLGWNINQAPTAPVGDPPPMTAALNGTFTLGLSGTVPPMSRFKVTVDGVDYCTNVIAGSNTIKTSDLKEGCYLPTPGAAYAGQPVENIGVQATTNETAASSFNFCITALSYVAN